MKPNDLVTVVTPTLGDSAGHVNRQMIDLRLFTKIPFTQIVSDDGTLEGRQKDDQLAVCRTHGAIWTENPGPTYGISYNMNHALEQVKTPWAFLVEDGLRSGMGWLETAMDAVERIGMRRWLGHKVGMMGTTHFNDWHLALAGALPTHLTAMDFLRRETAECYSAFWGSADYSNWNDGYWSWRRLWPLWRHKTRSPEIENWPRTPAPWNFIHLIRHGVLPPGEGSLPHVGVAFDTDPAFLRGDAEIGFDQNWPGRRKAHPAWFPGAFMLLNLEAWREMGRMRDGCPFFEGHLGIRMARAGYLSLYLDFPPWLHYGGMGFINAGRDAKNPRHHELTDGDNESNILYRDFGVDGPGHSRLYELVHDTFPPEKQEAIQQELASVDLTAVEGWRAWTL